MPLRRKINAASLQQNAQLFRFRVRAVPWLKCRAQQLTGAMYRDVMSMHAGTVPVEGEQHVRGHVTQGLREFVGHFDWLPHRAVIVALMPHVHIVPVIDQGPHTDAQFTHAIVATCQLCGTEISRAETAQMQLQSRAILLLEREYSGTEEHGLVVGVCSHEHHVYWCACVLAGDATPDAR